MEKPADLLASWVSWAARPCPPPLSSCLCPSSCHSVHTRRFTLRLLRPGAPSSLNGSFPPVSPAPAQESRRVSLLLSFLASCLSANPAKLYPLCIVSLHELSISFPAHCHPGPSHWPLTGTPSTGPRGPSCCPRGQKDLSKIVLLVTLAVSRTALVTLCRHFIYCLPAECL